MAFWYAPAFLLGRAIQFQVEGTEGEQRPGIKGTEACAITMKNSLYFVTCLATVMAMQTANLPRLQFNYSSRGYNQIPHKHQKSRRGKPK